MIQVQFEEMMNQNCRKHVRDQPGDMIVNNTLHGRIVRFDGHKKDSNQETSPFRWPLLLKFEERSVCVCVCVCVFLGGVVYTLLSTWEQ